MRSTFTGLEISKRSLFAQQASLQTTGHNIANANTRGYSRQVVHLEAAKAMEAIGMNRSTIPGQSGMGVEIQGISRMRETFLDKQYYSENKHLGSWTIRRDTLEKLEAIMNEPSDTGLRQVMDNFWDAWQELSKQPDNMETRAVVRETAVALADAFNHTAKKLSDLQSDLNDNVNVKVRQTQSTLEQIQTLNLQIAKLEGLGNNANDLRDRRDVLVDDLSKEMNITVTEQDDGYHIQMGTQMLVAGGEVTEMNVALIEAAYNSGQLDSGELFGLLESNQELVQNYMNQLDALAATFATEVNGVHQQGYTLQEPLSQGGAFFAFTNGQAAATLAVDANILNNVENIAASKRTYTDEDGVEHVVRGNNELALELSELRNKSLNFNAGGTGIVLNGGTFDEFLRAVVGELGVQGQEAKREASNQQVLVDQIDMRRQSVSGVSLDEEIANMIKFQHAYNAAARAMTTFDQVLDRVINQMGIVGR